MSYVLRVGDTSPRVAEARATLARLGQLSNYRGIIPDTTQRSQQYNEADTYFDKTLAEQLKAFQQARGIMPTGGIDEMTLFELRGATYSLGQRTLAFDTEDPVVGDDVAHLQKQLQELGFYSNRIDGHFGRVTEQALTTYQLNCGITPDGEFGPETARALSLLGRRITGGSAQAIREREHVRQAGPQLSGKRLIIDPALGGDERGQTVTGRYGAITEEEILWDLAKRIEERALAAGMEALFTRTHQDNPSPKDRAEMANAVDADLMISLACDHYPNEKANGVASFYFGSEIGNSSLTGETLSGYIQREIVARTPLTHCGNHGRTWEILRLTRMPSVDVVVGYLTNPHDVGVLTEPAHRDSIAEAVIVAVKRLYLLDEGTQRTGTYQFAELLREEQLG